MCDNCKVSGRVAQEKDATKEAECMSEMMLDFKEQGCEATLKQVVDIMKGKKVETE